MSCMCASLPRQFEVDRTRPFLNRRAELLDTAPLAELMRCTECGTHWHIELGEGDSSAYALRVNDPAEWRAHLENDAARRAVRMRLPAPTSTPSEAPRPLQFPEEPGGVEISPIAVFRDSLSFIAANALPIAAIVWLPALLNMGEVATQAMPGGVVASAIVGIAVSFVQFAAYVAMAAALYRMVLGSAPHLDALPLRLGAAEWRVCKETIYVWLIVSVAGMIMIAPIGLTAEGFDREPDPAFAVLMIPMVMLFGRLAVTIPSAANGLPMGFDVAWRRTRGNTLRITAVFAMMFAVEYVFWLPFPEWNEAATPMWVLSLAVDTLGTAWRDIVLALLYRALCPNHLHAQQSAAGAAPGNEDPSRA